MQPLTTACRPAQQGAASVNEKRSEEHQQTFGGLVGGGLRQEGTGLEGAINMSAAEEDIIIVEEEKSSLASMQQRITIIITVEINCGSCRKRSSRIHVVASKQLDVGLLLVSAGQSGALSSAETDAITLSSRQESGICN